MKIDVLSESDFKFLQKSLEINKGMSDEEFFILKKTHPYAFLKKDNPSLILSDAKYYGKHDDTLNSFLLNKFGNNDLVIDFFYELIYKVGDYTNSHLDKPKVIQTTLVLLSDNFKGGKLIINNTDMNFNKKGMIINFEGYKHYHKVEKVIEGERRVLVIMFNKKQKVL